MNIGCIHHGKDYIFDGRDTQKAKVHLKLILEKIQRLGVANSSNILLVCNLPAEFGGHGRLHRRHRSRTHVGTAYLSPLK